MVATPWKRTNKGYGHHKDKHFHKVVPVIENPCIGADYEHAVFSQRHEANPDELCFDLFFVANLATFTAYHVIDDYMSLGAYVGFFAILWATWFQITLHDVRFARDTVYERLCKTVQFVVFVGLALVGSKFEPNRQAKTKMNFRTLCYVLVLSRSLLAVQYIFVLVAVVRKRFTKLYVPLCLNIAIYALAVGVFVAMTPAFDEDNETMPNIYWIWWLVLFLEGAATITISCFWRMLSFKKTHLVERMGLLTLIVIGEGAIGVTKTVSKLMGKHGLDPEGSGLVLCILLVLVLIFMQYFDNHPHGHYGTIRQQIWALLHFPFQLAVVGVVEGSQQVVLARYITKNLHKFADKIVEYCVDDNLDGEKLVEKLTDAVEYFQLDSKPEAYRQLLDITADISALGNITDVCSKENLARFPSADWNYPFPSDFGNLLTDVFGGISISAGMKASKGEDPALVQVNSWLVVYLYFWVSMFLLFACIIAFLTLIRDRKNKADLFDWISIGGRVIMLCLCGLFAALAANDYYQRFLNSGAVLPTGMLMLLAVALSDHFARVYCNWRLRKAGYAPPPELQHDQHNNSSSHGGGHAHHAQNHDANHHQDEDEKRHSHRKKVRESQALGFRDSSPPRPISTLYLMSNFAATISNTSVQDQSAHVQHHRRQQSSQGGGGAAVSMHSSLHSSPMASPPLGGRPLSGGQQQQQQPQPLYSPHYGPPGSAGGLPTEYERVRAHETV